VNKAAKQWVAALRSGKYQQCTNGLRKGNTYCCLGVANEISGLGKWIDDYAFQDATLAEAEVAGEDKTYEEEFTSPDVQEWLGLRTKDGSIGGITLAELNDDGVPFDEIADIIEKHAHQIFK
jgi:hypothetical protein